MIRERARHIVVTIVALAASVILAPPASAQTPSFQVVSVDALGCNSGDFDMTVLRSNLTGGSYTVRTQVFVGAFQYMNENASISVNGNSGWSVFNNFTYGPVPSPGTYPIPANQVMTLEFSLEQPLGTILHTWILVVDGCNTGNILFNGPGAVVPTLPEWGMLALLLATLSTSVWHLRTRVVSSGSLGRA